jgi:alkylation response protein AidB-like acyl-CoA dehydrogenase
MRSLDTARDTCENYHPGLVKTLAGYSLTELEAPGSPVVSAFRAHRGPSLVIPAGYGGHGAGPLDAVRVMRAIGSLSPSLGAAATMHHFTAAMLFELARGIKRLTPRQVELLSRIAPDGLLLASGWAEGRTEQNILSPSVTATPAPEGGYVVNGSKKPCSLSASMDLLTASVSVPDEAGNLSLAVLLLPVGTPGIRVSPFWGSAVLAAAESDEVCLEEVHVPEDLVIRTTAADPGRLDDLQTAGFAWFELLITAVYTGVASALAERVLERKRGSLSDRAALSIRVESAVAMNEGTARAIADGLAGDEAVATVLLTRFAVQDALNQAADLAIELLGGISFITSPDVAYLGSAVRPLAFHPPSRTSAVQALADYVAGGPLLLS